jgi:signal transduction histidine kinase
MRFEEAWTVVRQTWARWRQIADLPQPQRAIFLERVRFIERALVLPVKGLLLLTLAWFLFFSNTLVSPPSSPPALAEATEYLRGFFLIYSAFSLGSGFMIWGMDEVSARTLERVVYSVSIFDTVMLTGMTLLTDGFESPLYWIYLAIIFRNFAVIPHADVQTLVSTIATGCFVLGGFLEQSLDPLGDPEFGRSAHGVFHRSAAVETAALRTLLLLLTTVCCHAIQVLAERKRQQLEEAQLFAIKQQQLEAAGRLAAEIAHQLKNPLGIINNAAYSLQKTVKEGKTITQQISIIREEVERSDRIITELMGYARLAEGRLERVNLVDELEAAIRDTFPGGASFDVKIIRQYGPVLPEMLGQSANFREVFANLLINARQAMNGRGVITVATRTDEDFAAIISIADNGPGIPGEVLEKIFEPYFTTKVGGTGLGLAIVKHNTEMYGGTVAVESTPGSGTRFLLKFPARSLIRIRK